MTHARPSIWTTLRQFARFILALGFLGLSLALAWLLRRSSGDAWWLNVIEWLARWEVFHVAAHVVIFGVAAWLLVAAPPRAVIWLSLLAMGLLLEVTQIVASRDVPGWRHVAGAAFDLGVDAFGILLGLMAASRRARARRAS